MFSLFHVKEISIVYTQHMLIHLLILLLCSTSKSISCIFRKTSQHMQLLDCHSSILTHTHHVSANFAPAWHMLMTVKQPIPNTPSTGCCWKQGPTPGSGGSPPSTPTSCCTFNTPKKSSGVVKKRVPKTSAQKTGSYSSKCSSGRMTDA